MTWVIQVKGKTTMKGVEKLVRKKQKNKTKDYEKNTWVNDIVLHIRLDLAIQ